MFHRRTFAACSFILIACCAAALAPAARAADAISLESLLREMIDRKAIAQLPEPWFTCSQASSYDRKSTGASDAETWFANGDASQYIREEVNGGRTEWVMMDADGPGAVVRIWSANPKGTLRIYLDGSETPALEAPMDQLLGGTWSVDGVTIGEPLSATRSRGWNLYLPVPYAKHCKITSDSSGFYYQVNYRTYEPGTEVESFTTAQLAEAAGRVDAVQRALAAAATRSGGPTLRAQGMLQATAGLEVTLAPGPAAVETITCRIKADDYDDALRQLVIKANFDDAPTVWAPAGDFFGSGIGVNTFHDWYRTVESDGAAVLTSRWIMPYQKKGAISLEYLGDAEIEAELTVSTTWWIWDNRSMHFHAAWRQQDPIPTRPMQDWNYIELSGKGVYVGDSLAVANPVIEWWGEGDEKIYVDGESFPSHFGTGTEDYYGYAWCCPDPFAGPFHAQPRCDGPGNYGHTAVSRVRLLDAIPFRKSLKFDMEVWHWKDCNVGYAATTFFYARPGVSHNRSPQPGEASRGALNPPPLPPPFTIAGAIECEGMNVAGHSDELAYGPQAMQGFGRETWSNDAHLWVRATNVGDFIEIEVPSESNAPVKVMLHATRSWDYGIVQFSIDGEKVDDPVDFFSGAQGVCKASGPIDLGVHKPSGGKLLLRAEVVGGNPKRVDQNAYFGLDCVVLEAAK